MDAFTEPIRHFNQFTKKFTVRFNLTLRYTIMAGLTLRPLVFSDKYTLHFVTLKPL
jgi:hypothetical protein